ncbi:MAG: HlyD family efflux transporter periplasmic adaptor subunit, partial [Planctomycetes bacterium]|nr:HlyD family efflux transporter periplasmic adaptor subunit [Planctomycetota bacterium]
MEECLDAGGPIVYQREGGWSFDGKTAGYRLHKQWHTAASGDAVASIPLRVDDETVAVLSIRQRADRPFTEEQVEQIRTKVEPLAPALILTQHANRSLTRHMADSVHAMIDALTTPGKVGRRITVGMIAVGLVWFTFGTMNYELAVPAVVTAAEIRHISSPFDGVLTAAHAVEGDRVSRGDVMEEFDRRDPEQERTQLLAELALQERIMDRARAQESPYEVQLGLAQQAVVNAKLAMVDRRIEQATITAPIDGVIVVGDLRKWISSVVAQGDPLFQVAPMDRWTLELQVPEASSAELSPDLAGSFATYARPQDVRRFRISRVLAAAQARDTRNVYIAEADVDARNDWIRPGMEGIAKIQLGPKPVWWIAFHRVIDYLRIHLWL